MVLDFSVRSAGLWAYTKYRPRVGRRGFVVSYILMSLCAHVVASCATDEDIAGFDVDVRVSAESDTGEFDEVITTMISRDGFAPRQAAFAPMTGDNFVTGVRVARFTEVLVGSYEITVALWRAGKVMAQQSAAIAVDGNERVEISLGAGVICIPLEVACGDGNDDDCDGLADCRDPDCLGKSCETTCIEEGMCRDGSCEQIVAVDCDDDNPCTDDVCEEMLGCTNEYNTLACDDGDACTELDICEEGICAGVLIDCDDDNACTDDSCDSTVGCVFAANAEPCDDGRWCNGTDACADGGCSAHQDAPCGDGHCNEGMMACVACNADADCGNVSRGAWSTCDYSGTCDEAAKKTRAVMTPKCIDNSCTTVESTETGDCERDRDGISCGATDTSAYGACSGFSGVCDGTGTQSRTVTKMVCRGGGCKAEPSSESRACTRSVPGEGEPCSTDNRVRCCGGKCANTTNDPNNCGLCGIVCPSGVCEISEYKQLGACAGATNSDCPSGFHSYVYNTCPADNGKCDCNAGACEAFGGLCSENYSGALFDVCYYPGQESYLGQTSCN